MLSIFRVNWEEAIIKINSTQELDSSAATDSETTAEKRQGFVIVYTGVILLGIIFYLSRSFSFFQMCIRISIHLHDLMFRRISRAKMCFFNNNPSGRILNRFANDIDSVDSLLPRIIIDILNVSIPNYSMIFEQNGLGHKPKVSSGL